MLRWLCKDQFTKELHRRGYSLVTLPDSSISPLQILGRQSGSLSRFGELRSLFQAGSIDYPEVRRVDNVAPINVTETSALDGSLGLSILGRFFGGKAEDVTSKINRSARFKIGIDRIERDYVDLVELDNFLAQSSLAIDTGTIEGMLSQDSLYIVTSVLKSSTLTLESEQKELVEADVKLPAEIAGAPGGASIHVNQESAKRIGFETERAVGFAFQAVQTFFEDGVYVALHPERRVYEMMGEEGEGSVSSEPGWLCDEVGQGFLTVNPGP